MRIPLKNQLRGQQAALAQLQDEALDIFYSVEPEAVLHGGTAIWRCYQGKRFSEDLDFYASANKGLRTALEGEAAKRGLSVSKFRKTQNSVYARISDGRTDVSVEVSPLRKKNRVLAAFEKADGSHTDIYTLSPEDLIVEKANAFAGRRLIRDIYDVYFLSGIANPSVVKMKLRTAIEKLPQPVDEKNLRTLIYAGVVPSFNEMVQALEWRLRP
ncbi:MAG: nucleotidyl transferase AbiEii/AbiGii toxin family protein [Candidatus Diapherotrites archaeon]|uniref:Nucleotidyl transferase AbiEii/AbiGii toxin family protein n=1 Tax=Candidatus Iainarchaeum sp. TaxID=3101447 RepID=A0A8T3YL57_9ARCH|nr:nucleotidyl transferase AbiEii/AbiGii toxin family protein [Candidatus Diapherotrites archaeon]